MWFALAALVLVPVLLSGRRVQPSGWPMRAFAGLAALGAVLAGIVALGAPARVERLWPSRRAGGGHVWDGVRGRASRGLAPVGEPSSRDACASTHGLSCCRPEELDAVSDLYAGRGSRVLEDSDVAVFAAADRTYVRTASAASARRDGGSDVAVLVQERA